MTDEVVARITVVGDDDTEAEEDALRLWAELRELDEDVPVKRLPTGSPPEDARAGELVELGTLLATLSAHSEVITDVLMRVGEWLQRRGRGRVEVTIGDRRLVLDNATPEEQRKIVDAFVEQVFPLDS